MDKFRAFFTGKSDLILVSVVMAILMILFIPVPPVMLDVLLIINFSMAMLILLLTFYTDKPLSFSTFPSLLLITTLFRLGLNISATRLILDGGEAGKVIGSIGTYVVGGNYVIGLVVFFILIIVQYVVVTNGAQRVAEVAARFTLDSLPGKQMSIDADLNMGMIDEHQAKSRRKELEKETSFYGAMDGASKFVKGDAIAGIIIILIDIVGGLSIGVAQLGLSWSEALHTYTLLTVGDGIVTQIPSLIIATATGIIITRATSDAQLGVELTNQFTAHPTTLYIVAFALFCMLFLPGLPTLPIAIISGFFFIIGYFSSKKIKQETVIEDNNNDEQISQGKTENLNDDFQSLLTVSPLTLKLSAELKKALETSEYLFSQLEIFRKQYAKEFGFILPKIQIIQESQFNNEQYELDIFGVRTARGKIKPDHHLAIDPSGKLLAVQGDKTKEPTFNLPAIWIDDAQIDSAKKANYTVVDAETTLLTHITETIKTMAFELITRSQTEVIVERLRNTHASLIEELIPNILSYSDVQRVLQNLVKEKVSIQNLELILETLVDKAKQNKDAVFLTDKVRERLKAQICQTLLDEDDNLYVVTLDAHLEQEMIANVHQEGEHITISMSPQTMDSVVRQVTQVVEKFMQTRKKPVLLCNPALRFGLKRMLERIVPQLHVLSINEIPTITSVKTAGSISLTQDFSA